MFDSESESENEFLNPIKSRAPRRFLTRNNFEHFTDVEFKERFRFSRQGVDRLLNRLGPSIHPKNNSNCALTGRQRLLLALRFYASGLYHYTNGDCHGVHKNSSSLYVQKVTDLIVGLAPEVIKWPSDATERQAISEKFYHVAKMPSVCGCIDGTLVNIKAPSDKNIEMQFVDRHGDHSLNCMAVCGPNLEFFYVNSNWPGAVNDARVLRNSSLCEKFSNGWRPFDRAILLGDSGYPLKEWLQVPILSPNPTVEIENFNRSHKKTRRLVENGFGVLKERFQCLKYMRISPQYGAKVFIACCVLHNILLSEDPEYANSIIEVNNQQPEVILNAMGLESEMSEGEESDIEYEENDRLQGLRHQKQLLYHFK